MPSPGLPLVLTPTIPISLTPGLPDPTPSLIPKTNLDPPLGPSQVLELMEGGDLSEAIKHDAEGELTWYNKGQRIALDIARGLLYLHSHDVRPSGRLRQGHGVVINKTLPIERANF